MGNVLPSSSPPVMTYFMTKVPYYLNKFALWPAKPVFELIATAKAKSPSF